MQIHVSTFKPSPLDRGMQKHTHHWHKFLQSFGGQIAQGHVVQVPSISQSLDLMNVLAELPLQSLLNQNQQGKHALDHLLRHCSGNSKLKRLLALSMIVVLTPRRSPWTTLL